MLEKLKGIKQKYKNIQEQLSDPEVIKDHTRYSTLMKANGALLKYITRIDKLELIRERLKEARNIIEDETDSELIEMANEELENCAKEEEHILNELEEMFLTDDGDDNRNVIIEIRPGTGGDEAALFASELFRMYQKYAEKNGWKIEIMESNVTNLGGIKQVTFSISGSGVYKALKFESGTHRVQRVPKTETSGRLHTSACTVAVLPEAEAVELKLKSDDIEMEVFRSSGPGGQHVNKTSSAVRLRHLPTGTVVACQTERSQHQNRDLAMRMLRAKIYETLSTQKKNKRDAIRKAQVGSGDRSEKIRTYNYPQSRITEHRVPFSVHNLAEVLEGALDVIIAKLQEYERELKIKNLSEKA